MDNITKTFDVSRFSIKLQEGITYRTWDMAWDKIRSNVTSQIGKHMPKHEIRSEAYSKQNIV